MRVFQFLNHGDVIQLYVQVLIDRFQRPAELDVVLKLYGDLVVNQSLEETIPGGASQRVSGE